MPPTAGDTGDRTLKKFAIKLHYQLLVGETGMQILGIVALLLFGFYLLCFLRTIINVSG
jgi:uncharacterized iron-regulated membrane protein